MCNNDEWRILDSLWERILPLLPPERPHPKGEQLYEAICYLKGTKRFLLMADMVVQGDESVVEAHLYDQLYSALGLSKES